MKFLKSILGISLVLALALTFTLVLAKGVQTSSAQKAVKTTAVAQQQNTGCGGYSVGMHVNMQELAAKALGISVDELVKKLQSGKTINDILKEKKLTVDQFKKKLYDLRVAEIDKLLKDGKITQQQAEFLKNHFQINIQYCIENILNWSNNGSGYGGMMGFGHGGGMMSSGFGGMMGY
ncbi:DUF2680 domain-containing protein [Caldicellulosiruptor changbaiensis]|uniref:DUF2680 domain-containing protein n=1 Tax=Caldicellulosiruptor changbaiensis TaxID=1222016 RepID=A0A3T0D405_9FIRM|nr:DUF2680 domain-containing protein [Caldicellulosiruptor changbaiensis]AZT89533.1 DUF2680 domain-containing protein [Caldicellulosiruptor changbaiensis]